MQTRLTLALCLALATSGLSQTQPVAARSAALSALFKDIWEDDLKRSPEFASALGDRRYNDQLSDISPKAFNDELGRHRDFLSRLIVIDTTGLPEQERVSAELLQRQLIDDEGAARLKGWELPINQSHGIHTDLPSMVTNFPFETVKDYDDYIARLHKIPDTLRQASENLLRGTDDHRVQPGSILEKALAQSEELANQTPEATPFAQPLKRFPAAIPAADRNRISAELLEAIQTAVLPAYVRFAKFLKVTEIPASDPAQTKPQPEVALSDEIRHTRIMEIRAKAQAALGSKFDAKAFTDLVTANGIQTGILEQRVSSLIASAK